jgi:hypothetical protein
MQQRIDVSCNASAESGRREERIGRAFEDALELGKMRAKLGPRAS